MLAKKSQVQKPVPEKATSEHAVSTNLSEGSNEIDDEFKQKEGEKFEFINEKVEQWPQWTVDDKTKEKNAQENKGA